MEDEPPETFLLDTNVISEVTVDRPDPNVMEWLEVWDTSQTYISVMTMGEIRKGIHSLKPSKKRASLERWLTRDLWEAYKNRVLPVDGKVAHFWGETMADYPNNDAIDMIMAATALAHNMTLVTRNEKDFNVRGLRIMNPWKQ
jgi:toxin FitB